MGRKTVPKQARAVPYHSYGNQHAAIDAALKRDAETRRLTHATEGQVHDFEPVDGLVDQSALIREHDRRMIEALGMSPRFVSLDDVKALQNQPERESKVD